MSRRSPLRLARAVPGPGFTFTFDGHEVPAQPGQSVAAALWSAGVLSWRTTRVDAAPRGVFCGIGVCFDCLVTVNGRPGVRACVTEAHPGDVVTPQAGTGELP
ncbi:(2Fe-2S)-binding protein [Streptomyces sp. NPDC008238]